MVKLCFFIGAIAIGAGAGAAFGGEGGAFLGGICGALFGAFMLGKAS